MVADWFDKPRPQSVTTNAAPSIPPRVGHASQDLDERPGDYLEERYSSGGFVGGVEKFVVGEKPSPMDHPAIVKRFAELSRGASRYPAPLRADLVTLWKRGRQSVLSITADGKVHDFHLPPARLVVLLREIADHLAESTILQ